MPEASAVEKTGPQTSIDTYSPTECTVRFRRWTPVDNTAYLRGQEAGFSLAQAREMQRRGMAIDIVSVPERKPLAGTMIRK